MMSAGLNRVRCTVRRLGRSFASAYRRRLVSAGGTQVVTVGWHGGVRGSREWGARLAAVPAHASGRGPVPVVPIAVDDPDMTRERRAALMALRRTHVAQGRAGLGRLPHFDPVFPHDIVHEYGLNWTTDPDYGHDAVKYVGINGTAR